MVKRMTKVWACIVAILLMVSILPLNVNAINTDDTIAYGYTAVSRFFESQVGSRRFNICIPAPSSHKEGQIPP